MSKFEKNTCIARAAAGCILGTCLSVVSSLRTRIVCIVNGVLANAIICVKDWFIRETTSGACIASVVYELEVDCAFSALGGARAETLKAVCSASYIRKE